MALVLQGSSSDLNLLCSHALIGTVPQHIWWFSVKKTGKEYPVDGTKKACKKVARKKCVTGCRNVRSKPSGHFCGVHFSVVPFFLKRHMDSDLEK